MTLGEVTEALERPSMQHQVTKDLIYRVAHVAAVNMSILHESIILERDDMIGLEPSVWRPLWYRNIAEPSGLWYDAMECAIHEVFAFLMEELTGEHDVA